MMAAEKNGMTGRAMLRKYGFRRGKSVPPLELSPEFDRRQAALLRGWLETLPPEFTAKLRRVKAAPAADLTTPEGHLAHAAAFIPECYLLLGEPLFRRRGELGRILFHELCHFLWPRLRRGRRIYEAALAGQLRERTGGELGFSAALARCALRPDSAAVRDRCWKHYLCTSGPCPWSVGWA